MHTTHIVIIPTKALAHHGGAWKVAYADFVTAMMAFFLLMWLLNATEAEKLSGLADYFAPTVGIKGEMGIGFRGGKAALSEGIGADKNTNRGIIYGATTAGPVVRAPQEIETATDEPEVEKISVTISDQAELREIQEVAENIEKHTQSLAAEAGTKLTLKQIDEGLEIQISDKTGRAMFDEGSSDVTPSLRKVLESVASVARTVPNYISITGHTSSRPLLNTDGRRLSNWELSAERALAARWVLVDAGVNAERVARISAKADYDPKLPATPEDVQNNRITIVLLKNALIPEHRRTAPGRLFSEQGRGIKESNDVSAGGFEKPVEKTEAQKLFDSIDLDSLDETQRAQDEQDAVQPAAPTAAPGVPLGY